MALEPLINALYAEAAECAKSSVGNGEYNTAFHVASIILESLAKRLATVDGLEVGS